MFSFMIESGTVLKALETAIPSDAIEQAKIVKIDLTLI